MPKDINPIAPLRRGFLLIPCRRICTNKSNVPADLQSAGIEYKNFQSACFLFLINRYDLRIKD